jgi:hypothetical protein
VEVCKHWRGETVSHYLASHVDRSRGGKEKDDELGKLVGRSRQRGKKIKIEMETFSGERLFREKVKRKRRRRKGSRELLE